MDRYTKILLGGYAFADQNGWMGLLTLFRQAFHQVDPLHPIFQNNDWDPSHTIPYITHEDEGKGPRPQPFMVQSWQTVLSVHGPEETNISGSLASNSLRIFFLFLFKIELDGIPINVLDGLVEN